jgi:hypothetical protein
MALILNNSLSAGTVNRRLRDQKKGNVHEEGNRIYANRADVRTCCRGNTDVGGGAGIADVLDELEANQRHQ